jgi:hypothetical protein
MYVRERFHATLRGMAGAVSLDVTQAAQWFLRDDEQMDYPWEEFPALVPPYTDLWMEFTLPRQLRTKEGLANTVHFLTAAGVHLYTSEIRSDNADSIRGRHYEFLGAAMEELSGGAVTHQTRYDDDPDCDVPPKWLVYGQTVLANERQVQAVNLWAMTLDDRGRFLRRTATPLPWGYLALAEGSSAEAAYAHFAALDEARQWTLTGAVRDTYEQPFLFCLSLLHCRNVAVLDKPPLPPAVRKQREKKGIPDIEYKLLDVVPLHAVRHRGQEAQKGASANEPKPLHFVRGHFKDYSVTGLFGRHKGIYWWDSQVRGEARGGVVDKDYRLRRE